MKWCNDVTMLEEVAFVSFLSFYAGLVIILWLTDIKFRNLTKYFSGFVKVTDLISYSQTVHGKLLILHLLSIHLYIVTFITFIYFLKTVQSFHIIFFHINFWYYLGNHLFKKNSPFKDRCWVIFDYFRAHFSGVYIKVLYYSNSYCTKKN